MTSPSRSIYKSTPARLMWTSIFPVAAAMATLGLSSTSKRVSRPVAAGSPCVSDTSSDAKAILNRYRTMMDVDSMSVLERHIAAIDRADPATVVVVTDPAACRAARAAYRRVLGHPTTNRSVSVVKVGNRYIVNEPDRPVSSSGYVILDGGNASLTFDSTFTTKLAQTL